MPCATEINESSGDASSDTRVLSESDGSRNSSSSKPSTTTTTTAASTTAAPSTKYHVACDYSASVKKLTFEHYAACFLWLGWLHVIISLPLFLPLLYYFCFPLFTAFVALVVASALYPLNDKMQPAWGKALGSWIMHKAREYFGLKMIFEDKDKHASCGPAIIVLEPHDVLPVSIFALSDYLGYNEGHTGIGCLTSICFAIPLMKHIYTWASATSVDKSNIVRLMKEGKSISVCPGGAQEVTYMTADENDITLYLKKRMGLVKLALQFGRPLIPVFTFNQRSTYSFSIPTSPLIRAIGKQLGFIPMVFYGVLGLPFSMPKPTPITVVVGEPIPVPKVQESEITDELVCKYHTQLLEAIEKLFHTHKEACGKGSARLTIL